MHKTFSSKIDWWMGLLLCILPLLSIGAALGFSNKSHLVGAGGGFGFLLIAALYIGFVFPLRYELHEDALLIRFGLMRRRLAYDQIIEVQPSRNPLSSPALSLDRLHLRARESFGVLISPKDKSAFLDVLAQRCPHLQRKDNALTASSSTPS